MRRAVIDIGTNTVKLLVAEVAGGAVQPLFAGDRTTRLGAQVEKTGRLSATAIARTVATVAEYFEEARRRGAGEVAALTTSAVRDAANGAEFLAAVRARCGLTVAAISGAREAALIFHGVASDPAWAGQPLVVVDVGGGSAEAIQGRGELIERWQSRPLGAVRLTERFGQNQFAALGEHVRGEWQAGLAGYDLRGRTLIGTGGAITNLAAIAVAAGAGHRGRGRTAVESRTGFQPVHPDRRTGRMPVPLGGGIDHLTLGLAALRGLVARLQAMPLAERKRVPGLPSARADIIVAGGLVFLVAMEVLGATEITVSLRSLRYGALLMGRS